MNSPGKYKSLDLQVARDKLYHILFSALFRDFSENRPYSCVRG